MTAPAAFDLNEGYASFRPVGPTTMEGFLLLLDQARRACQEQGLTKLLVNATRLSHRPLMTADWFQWGSGLAVLWDRNIRLAMVARTDQIDPDRFGALVAQNRGLHYGLFTNEEEALGWLLEVCG